MKISSHILGSMKWWEKKIPGVRFKDLELVYKKKRDGSRGAYMWVKATTDDFDFSVFGEEFPLSEIGSAHFLNVLEPHSLLYHDIVNERTKETLQNMKNVAKTKSI